jgi:hypothetical protein
MTNITQEFHIKHHLLREHLTFSVTGGTLLECLETKWSLVRANFDIIKHNRV